MPFQPNRQKESVHAQTEDRSIIPHLYINKINIQLYTYYYAAKSSINKTSVNIKTRNRKVICRLIIYFLKNSIR